VGLLLAITYVLWPLLTLLPLCTYVAIVNDMEETPMTSTIEIREMQANEGGRGNLAGHEVRCTCGYREGTTLATQVASIANQHAQWHERKGAA
jgi:hypothetical protein